MSEVTQTNTQISQTAMSSVPLAWETPVLVELRVGMEVTSYESADIDTID